MSEKKGKKNGIVKTILTTVITFVMIFVLIVGSFFAILDGLVEIIEQFIAKALQIIGDFFEAPLTYIEDLWASISNFIDENIKRWK